LLPRIGVSGNRFDFRDLAGDLRALTRIATERVPEREGRPNSLRRKALLFKDRAALRAPAGVGASRARSRGCFERVYTITAHRWGAL